ncbi:Uma2 family endonuclease [Pseudonocardia sp. CA-107938]|uniref:Uma2 family endonuclease n=1 Tax=Pseudonocardia sp. CA-107938 TaxID=3240021 RepID=UPI003D8F5A09
MAADPTIAPRKRFTVDEYELLGKVGILAEDERWELLDGEIVAMSPIGPTHAGVVERVTESLYRAAIGRVSIRVQNPIRLLPRSEPEPDVVVSRARRDYYASAHPTAEDVFLVIEVSDSTMALDRGVKIPIYAEQGIPEVWIVDVKAEVVHVHTEPEGRSYRTVRSLGIGDVLVPTTVEDVTIPVADLF